MTASRHHHGSKVTTLLAEITDDQSGINVSLTISDDDLNESESIIMLQADITELERRQTILEREIAEALSHVAPNDSMIVDLKSRVLFVREQIDILRDEANDLYH